MCEAEGEERRECALTLQRILQCCRHLSGDYGEELTRNELKWCVGERMVVCSAVASETLCGDYPLPGRRGTSLFGLPSEGNGACNFSHEHKIDACNT